MLEDKIYTLEEMRSLGIDTHEYMFMDQPGETTGMLMLKAESRTPSIRMFFSLSDGRKILTPVFWWQLGRGFSETDAMSIRDFLQSLASLTEALICYCDASQSCSPAAAAALKF